MVAVVCRRFLFSFEHCLYRGLARAGGIRFVTPSLLFYHVKARTLVGRQSLELGINTLEASQDCTL